MMPQAQNPHRPKERLLLSTPIGLKDLGAEFDPSAPFSACRLCGALYQHEDDRACKTYLRNGVLYELIVNGYSKFVGPDWAVAMLDQSTSRRIRWRNLHERRYHSTAEIEAFAKTGYAMTPEAAHRLAPFGIAPLLTDSQEDNLSFEIEDALHSAPRKPTDDAES